RTLASGKISAFGGMSLAQNTVWCPTGFPAAAGAPGSRGMSRRLPARPACAVCCSKRALAAPQADPGAGDPDPRVGLEVARGEGAGDRGQVGPRRWVADVDGEFLDVPAAGAVDRPGGQALAGQVGQVSGRVSGGGRSAGESGQIGPRPGVADPDREFLDMPGG